MTDNKLFICKYQYFYSIIFDQFEITYLNKFYENIQK